jgi:predicted peroxiredoxin
MKLGILVNTDKHLPDIIGITNAAIKRGHDVIIFTMDTGTKLFSQPEYTELCKLNGVKMSFCDYNAKLFNIETAGIPDEVVCGSQLDNASMNHECDKVIVL